MLTPHLKKAACHQPAGQRQLALACDPGLNLAANATTLREHALRVAERIETDLGEERSGFIDGCPAE
jgi:hypothetical protein